MDHRAVRLALGLTIAGALMLTAGVATWLFTAVGQVASGPGPRDLRLAALALLAGGAACGVAMALALAAAGRARMGGPPLVAGVAGLTQETAETPAAAPSLAEARSLMNPPPPGQPPLAPSRVAPPRWSGGEWSRAQPPGDQRSGEQPPAEQPPGEQPPAERAFAGQPSGEQSPAAQPSGERAFPGQLSGEQASAGPAPAGRVWWRAARSPASGWDDTSEEWLRSLRGPSIQQPPPHSAE
jgi:hypothetical protein